MFPRPFVLVLLLLLPMSTWAARLRGIQLYERGDYAGAVRKLKAEVNNPQYGEKDRARARVYLAASLQALGKEDEAFLQLEELARTYPAQRVDPALFPPELVRLELKVREQLETERQVQEAERRRQEAEQAELNRIAAAEDAERRRKEQEAAVRDPQVDGQGRVEVQDTAPAEPVSSFRLRPELTGYGDAGGWFNFERPGKGSYGPAVALTAGIGPVEATVRTLIGKDRLAWDLEAGYLIGTGAFQPRVAARATLFPGIGKPAANETTGGPRFGFGGSVGGRLALSSRFTVLADLGAVGIPDVDPQFNALVVVFSAGVGYSLF
jgi:hypothetical protein